MPKSKNFKNRKQRKKSESMKFILMPGEESTTEQEEEDHDGEMGGMYLDKDDIRLIYNALRKYKPTEKEAQLWEILCEEFEETLVVDYGDFPPDAK